MYKRKNKSSSKKAKVLKLNLSATMVVAGIIVFVIIAIIAVKMIVTAINSRSQRAMAEEETKGYTMVDSTELGEDGKPLQVPVPDGFTASQVPGETTVNGGFVIYEGEVDWSKIEDLNSYAEVATQAEEIDSSSENSNSTDNTNSEDTSTESNSSDVISNSTDANSEQVDSQEESATNGADAIQTEEANQENGITTDQINQLNSNEETENKTETNVTSQEEIDEEENITEEQQIEEETNQEIIEQEKQVNNAIVNEEEPISNEEVGVATIAEEGNEGIETLAEGETPTTVFELQISTNQYVWVPVKDVSRIYGIASNGKMWGKLWQGVATEASRRSPQDSDWSESNGIMNIKDKTGYREPDVVPRYSSNRYDVDGKLQGYRDGIEQYQMLSQEMEENYYKMIESVKKYGGFYIGRYETGDLGKEEAVVKKMNTDINYQTWYTMYEKCKNLAGTNENVQTSMIWGSLWDETIQWLLESGVQIQDGENGTREITESDINTDSTNWGNYKNATFEYRTTSGGTSTKNASSSTRIPTGSAEYTKANNIYDLAGNVRDWTLEAYSTRYRVSRGGIYSDSGSRYPARSHYDFDSPTYSLINLGCRSSLYIK